MRLFVSILCLSIFIGTTQSTVISNLNLIFETFAPFSMVRFFEFNDIGWNITENCIKDMFLYLDALHKDVQWAIKCQFKFTYFSIIFIVIKITSIESKIFCLMQWRHKMNEQNKHENDVLIDENQMNGTVSMPH